jgi:hypothetical protein
MVKKALMDGESQAKKLLAVERWINGVGWEEALERLVSRPTVNIEGLVAGYTGKGGKTVLPHKAVAKLDLRLVPDMTADGAHRALKEHLAKRAFGDLEVRVTGGYDPSSTSGSGSFNPDLQLYPAWDRPAALARSAGSWQCVFTGDRCASRRSLRWARKRAHGQTRFTNRSTTKLDGIDGAAFVC